MGKGLFGAAARDGNGLVRWAGSGSGGLSDRLGSTLGNLLQQGFGQGRSIPPPAPATPASGAKRPRPAGAPGQPADERHFAAVV